MTEIGEGVPAGVELGYHLCYGSPADGHLVQPKDAGLMVEIANAISARVQRPIPYFHLPVSKNRTTAPGMSRLKASAPAGRKNGSFLPHTASNGGLWVRK